MNRNVGSHRRTKWDYATASSMAQHSKLEPTKSIAPAAVKKRDRARMVTSNKYHSLHDKWTRRAGMQEIPTQLACGRDANSSRLALPIHRQKASARSAENG